jgi:hypothetical protein
MDTAGGKIARLERSIGRTGESIVLERLATDPTTGASVVVMSVVLPAWVRSSEPQDLLAGDGVRDIRIVVSPTILMEASIGSPPMAFGLPQRDDRIIVQGSSANIQDIMPIYWGGALVRVNLLARG